MLMRSRQWTVFDETSRSKCIALCTCFVLVESFTTVLVVSVTRWCQDLAKIPAVAGSGALINK